VKYDSIRHDREPVTPRPRDGSCRPLTTAEHVIAGAGGARGAVRYGHVNHPRIQRRGFSQSTQDPISGGAPGFLRVAAQVLKALVGDVILETRQVEAQAKPQMVARFTTNAVPALAVLNRSQFADADD